MDPPGPVSAVQTSLSPSSASETPIASGPGPEANKVQEKEVLEIDLCSEENASVASHSFGSDSDDESGDEPESKLVAEIREVLNKWERKVQKNKKLKEIGGISQERGHQEPGCSEKSNVQLSLSPLGPSTSASLEATKEIDGEREEFKWKLEMVTAQLSRSRMDLVKKVKKSAARKPLVIEVPEFPIEYYNKVEEFLAVCGTPKHWYLAFNNYNTVITKQTEYVEWIQTRTTEYLPKVLEIMTTVWNKTAPVTSQLNNSNLLKCRLVSKSWKQSVDKLIQDPGLNLNSQKDFVRLVTKVDSRDYTQLLSCILDKSFNALKPHPFPSRSLIVSAYPLEDEKSTKEFTWDIGSLLLKYGMDLHHFGYHGYEITHKFFDDTTPYTSSWTTLTGWLKKMPNLRSLEITLQLSEQVSSKDTRAIDCYPFPKLAKLVAFGCHQVPSFILEEVLRRNKAIEKLECFQLAGIQNWPKKSNKLKNLSEFSMDASKMSHILVLQEVKWPLRKLTLSSGPTHEELIDICVLFATLKSFQETLQELSLKLWVTCSGKNLRLDLPHLKNLELFLMEGENEKKISYDFLLPLDHLEMLKLGFEQEENVTNEVMGEVVQVIQLRGYLHRLYESNVWKLFPCLKKVDIFYKDGCAKDLTYFSNKIPM